MKATKSIGYLIIGLFCTTVGVKAMADCVGIPMSVATVFTGDKYKNKTIATATANYPDGPVKNSQEFIGSSTIFYFDTAQGFKKCPLSGTVNLRTWEPNQQVTEDVTFDFQWNSKAQIYNVTCSSCSYDRCCAGTSKLGNLSFGAGDKQTNICAGVPRCGR